MPEAAEIVLRLVGLLYLLAGAALMRHLVMDHVLDQALSGLTLKPIPARDTTRRWLLGSASIALGMGGAALMVLNIWSVPLFLFVAFNQTAYFLWARKAFPPEENATGGAKGRNAAIFYGGVTLLVCWLGWTNQLHPWLDPLAFFAPIAGLAILLGIGRHFFWQARRVSSWDIPEPLPPDPLAPPRAVVLAPDWGGRVLADADRDDWLDYDLFVPPELAERIYQWSQAFHAGEDYEIKEFWVQFTDKAHEAAHRAEGQAIVTELKTIFGEEGAFGPTYPDDVRYG
jgi:hypothetical protein